MTKSDYIALLEAHKSVASVSYEALDKLLFEYPYLVGARLLLLKKYQLDENPRFEDHLHLTASYCVDRGLLFDWINKGTGRKIVQLISPQAFIYSESQEAAHSVIDGIVSEEPQIVAVLEDIIGDGHTDDLAPNEIDLPTDLAFEQTEVLIELEPAYVGEVLEQTANEVDVVELPLEEVPQSLEGLDSGLVEVVGEEIVENAPIVVDTPLIEVDSQQVEMVEPEIIAEVLVEVDGLERSGSAIQEDSIEFGAFAELDSTDFLENLELDATNEDDVATPSFKEWLLNYEPPRLSTSVDREQAKEVLVRAEKVDILDYSFDKNKEIIEKIIKKSTDKIEEFPEVEWLASKSVFDNQVVISETLAILLAKQGKKEKAVWMFKNLMLQNPNKSTYFAALIEKYK